MKDFLTDEEMAQLSGTAPDFIPDESFSPSLSPAVSPEKKKLPYLVREPFDFVSNLGKGFTKGLISTASGVQELGLGIGNIAGIDTYGAGLKSLRPDLPEYLGSSEQLKYKGGAVAQLGGLAGRTAEFTGELAVPAGMSTKIIQTLRAPKTLIKLLTPRLGPVAYREAAKAANVVEQGLFREGSAMEGVEEAARAIKEATSALGRSLTTVTSGSISSVMKSVTNLIRDYSKKFTSAFLSRNPVPFNFEDLISTFDNVTPHGSLKSGTQFETWSHVREQLQTGLANYLRTTGKFLSTDDFNDIWNARKVMDNIIKTVLKTKAFNSDDYIAVNMAARAYRNAFKQFLSDSYRYPGQMGKVQLYYKAINDIQQTFGRILTEAEKTGLRAQMGVSENPQATQMAKYWDDMMDRISSMYDGLDNLSTKVPQEQGKTGLKAFIKAHPVLSETIKGTGLVVGGGAVGGAISNLLFKD